MSWESAPSWSARRSAVSGAAGRGGFALATAVLLLLALGALGGGALFMARRELEIADASAALVAERVAAEGAVRRALRGLADDTLPALETWQPALLLEGSAERVAYRADAVRLSAELVLLRGSAWTRAGAPPAPSPSPSPTRPDRPSSAPAREEALLTWALAPDARVGAARGVVEVGGAATGASRVDARPVAAPPEGWPPSACAPWHSVLDSLFRVRQLPGVAPLGDTSAIGFPSLGALDRDDLLERIPARAAGSVTPGPVVVWGRCAEGAANNWGSPADPRGPCGGHRPAVAASGDLTLRGGQGQGVLVVLGSLRLTDGIRYAGLLLVGGDLSVEEGALVEGLARVGGELRIADGRIVASACPVLLALRDALPLRTPRALREGGWLAPL